MSFLQGLSTIHENPKIYLGCLVGYSALSLSALIIGFILCSDVYGPGPAFVAVTFGLGLCAFAGHLWFVALSLFCLGIVMLLVLFICYNLSVHSLLPLLYPMWYLGTLVRLKQSMIISTLVSALLSPWPRCKMLLCGADLVVLFLKTKL